MAELKKYREQGDLLSSPGQLTTAALKEAAISNERLNKFLGQASEYFYKEAVDYAQDKAIEDAIRNPITREQVIAAQQTGDNPIEDYLKGGRVYNEALTKVLGQQIAGELNIDFHKHQADVLEKVRLGQISNAEEMLSALKEPIQAQVQFLGQFDPELATQYANNAAISTKSVYLKGDAIFSEQKEQQARLNAEAFTANTLQDYTNFIDAYPDATPEKRKMYRDTVLKIAQDHSFSMSRDQVRLTEQLRADLEDLEDRNVAQQIATQYKGKNINEVLQQLPKDKSVQAEYYKQKDLKERDAFKTHLNNALSIVNAGQDELRREVTYNINKARDFINRQQPIPQSIKTFINENIDKDSLEYIDWKLTEDFSSKISTYNQTPLITKDGTGLIDKLKQMEQRQLDVNVQTSYEENKQYDLLSGYVKNIQTQLKDDYVGTMLRRSGVYQRIDFTQSPDKIAQQVAKRKTDLNTRAEFYGLSKAEAQQSIMTKEETSAFVRAYMKGDGATRVAMLQIIDQGFGDSNGAALLQLVNEGLPTTAELSSYFNDPMKTERFLSFDEEEERKRLREVATRQGTSYDEITKKVSAKLQPFLQIVMRQNGFNKSIATKKMDNIFDALTFYAINELQSGKTINAAVDEATKLIDDGFQIEDSYYIPKLYNGQPVDADAIATKAQRIKDLYLKDFDPLPFPTMMEGIDESEIKETMRIKMIENGEWRNTADGTGLVFGIVMNDGSFGLVENADGENLTFKFDDISAVVPTTQVDITAPKGETRIEYMGRKKREQMSEEEYKKRYGVKKGTR